jgi:hypothetical protein
MSTADGAELPIHKRLRARRILLHGGSEEGTRWAFEFLTDAVNEAVSYDSRFPDAAALSLLKCDLNRMPEACLKKLALLLGDNRGGIMLDRIPDLIMLMPPARTFPYLAEAELRIDPKRDLFNMASIAYVRAMHGDGVVDQIILWVY